jgi:hypothetical protein
MVKILLGIFVILGMGATTTSIWSFTQIYMANDWPAVAGIVESSGFIVTGSRPSTAAQYVTYRYQVSGQAYRGQRAHFGIAIATHNAVLSYHEGQSVTVYYDPNDHQNSVLRRDDARPAWFGLIVGVAFIAFATFGWRLEVKRHRTFSGQEEVQ